MSDELATPARFRVHATPTSALCRPCRPTSGSCTADMQLWRVLRAWAPPARAPAQPARWRSESSRDTAAPPVALAAGAAVRTADQKGRIKPGFSRPLAELLGWKEGDLACHIEGSWLVLTQPAELCAAARRRNSTRAHLKAPLDTTRAAELAPATEVQR